MLTRAVCCGGAPVQWPEPFPCLVGLIHGCPGDSLPLCQLVQLQFPQGPRHGAPGSSRALIRPSRALACESQMF